MVPSAGANAGEWSKDCDCGTLQAAQANAPEGLTQRHTLSPDVDWDCGACRNINRATRTECNRCGRPRAETKRSPAPRINASGHPNIGGRVGPLSPGFERCLQWVTLPAKVRHQYITHRPPVPGHNGGPVTLSGSVLAAGSLCLNHSSGVQAQHAARVIAVRHKLQHGSSMAPASSDEHCNKAAAAGCACGIGARSPGCPSGFYISCSLTA